MTRSFTQLALIALHSIALAGCGANLDQGGWDRGPALVGDERYVWLSGPIDRKALPASNAYWTVKVPKGQLPENFLQAFECQSANQYTAAVVLLHMEVNKVRYTILEDGLLLGVEKNGGVPSIYIYTDYKAFQATKDFLLRYVPKVLKKDVLNWRMSQPNCAKLDL
jgi:hypothetical protein